MQELTELLSKRPQIITLQKSQADYEADLKKKYSRWFSEIANYLLRNCVIEAGEAKYRLLEIEFYYHSENHKDKTTYGYAENMKNLPKRVQRHKKAQRNQLTWLVHYSGIDITIGSGDNPGGILIRAIEREDGEGNKELIKGPLVVLLELMNQKMTVDGSGSFKLSLVKEKVQFNGDEQIETQKRIGINSGGFEDEAYNFFVTPLIKRTPPSKTKSEA